MTQWSIAGHLWAAAIAICLLPACTAFGSIIGHWLGRHTP